MQFNSFMSLDLSKKVNLNAASTLRRSLLGYRLDINATESVFLSPSTTSYLYKRPKHGQTYTFTLAAITCAIGYVKERRIWVC